MGSWHRKAYSSKGNRSIQSLQDTCKFSLSISESENQAESKLMRGFNGVRVSTQISEEQEGPTEHYTNSIREKPQRPQDICQPGFNCKPPDHKGQ